jgi:DNA repair protein RadD
MSTLRELRPHQERALEALRQSLVSGHKRPMLQAPTGFGKTLTAAHIIQRALDKGKRVAFVVPALSLIDQTVRAFEAEGISAIGVMQGDHERTDRTQPVQVATVQTLARRSKPEVDLILVDEAHVLHRSLLKWMGGPVMAKVPFIGLSATPWARGLGKFYDDLIVAATTGQLIADGFLSPFMAYAPSNPDLSGVRTVAGDFQQDELSAAMDRPSITGDVITTWQAKGEDRPTLVYGVDRAHAEHLKQRFEEAGVSTAYIDCFTDREERERIFALFRAGEIRVISNVATLSIGIDLPMVSCVVDARPTKSKMRFVQTIGRGLRTAEGKTNCIILDHAGNHLRLGMVTDIHQDKLDDGSERQSSAKERENGEPLPRLCKFCKAVMPREAKVCPACGEEVVTISRVRVANGDLVELGTLFSGKSEPADYEKKIFYAELRGLAKPHYKPTWVSCQFRDKYGHWPPWAWASEPVLSPSLSTRNWVLSRQIAFVKGRRAYG